MKRTIAMFLALIWLTGLCATAIAEDEEEPQESREQPVSQQKAAKSKAAGGNYTIGIGPVGNIFVVDSNPELSPGVGGYLFFDYRWSPQFSTQFGVLVTTEDGKGITSGDDGIEFLGIPTFDLKFYILSNPSRWDPYGLIGMGIYAISEGTNKNGTTAVGIGADVGLGCDFYITERFSVGFATIFRSIGLIDSTSGANNGTALFPVSLLGNIAYHF